jgi:tetratricopeptide (TPR) repeat protein
MMALKNIFLMIFFLGVGNFLLAQTSNQKDYIVKGNQNYEQLDYSKAEAQYRAALAEEENSIKANFNLGNALYQQQKYEQSRTHYDKVVRNRKASESDKSKAYHNIGKTYLDEKKPDKAVENFKEALKLNPNDDETRYNYALAKKMLEEQENQQQNQDSENNNEESESQNNQNKNKEQQENQNSDNNRQQQQQDNQQQQQNNEQQQQNNAIQSSDSGQQSREEEPEMEMTADELRQQSILEAIGQQERETLRKIMDQRAKVKRSKTEKDW